MATGVTALEKTLIGVEATQGSGTPTTHWRGMGKIKDRLEVVFPPEKVGRVGGTTRSYIPKTGGEVELTADATYEQLCYIFNSAFYHVAPTTDASSAQIRTWNVQTSSSDAFSSSDLDVMVVENGDNIEVETAHYCFVREWTLSGKQGEGLQISAILESRAPSTSGSFTSVGSTDLDNPAETVLLSKGLLYIDPSTDAAGTTQKSETILEISLKHTTGWMAIPAKDGRLDFSNIKRVDDNMVLDVAFEHNSVAITEKNAWRNQTERVLRLKYTGSALSTTDAGASYDTKTLVIDLYGKWSQFGAEGFEEQDGDNIYRGTFQVRYASASAANKATFVIANEVATLP